MIEIKDIQGRVIHSTEINKGAKRKFQLMQEDCITLPFSLEAPVGFGLGSYVEIDGIRYEIVTRQKPTYNKTTGGYDYNLRFDAYYWKWKNKIFKFTPQNGGQEASWSLTAKLDVHLDVFTANLKALGYYFNYQEFTYSIDGSLVTKNLVMTYSSTSLTDALSAMAEQLECDWWVDKNVIHFGRCEKGTCLNLEVGSSLTEMKSSASQSSGATRLYVFGSTRNLPSDYNSNRGSVSYGVAEKRLTLPEEVPYIDVYPNQEQEEAIEEVVIIEDVYPKTEGQISDVETYDSTVKNDDGSETTETFYRFKDKGITFSEKYVLEGEELKAVFTSGALNGMEFGIRFNPEGKPEKVAKAEEEPLPEGQESEMVINQEAQMFEIVANETYGRKLPDGVLRPSVGDKYILIGWDTSAIGDLGLVSQAETLLLEKGREIANKRRVDPNTYNCKVAASYVYELGQYEDEDKAFFPFELGRRVSIISNSNAGNVDSRIIGFEYELDYPYDNPALVIGETASYSRIGALESKVETMSLYGTGGGEVNSALYLRKDRSDRSKGTIASDKGLEVGKFSEGTLGSGASIYKDETNATHIEADYLKIRRKAVFTTITVQELKHVGGEIVLSPAAMVCSKVEEVEGGYKCFFNKKDNEGREVYNDFQAGDFARCQVFNLVEGSKFYWRYVMEANEDYIVLSKTYRVGEDIPTEGDNIVQLGNENDPERQNAIIMSAYGTDAPSYKQYTGINRMELTEDMIVTRISPSGNLFKGEFVTKTGSSVSDEIENIKVDWDKILQQTDKEFTMWFYGHAPTLDNIPAVEWVTEDLKLLHEEDLFYDTSTGLAYRFTFNGEAWAWDIVTDAETIKALEKAAKAQETADDAIGKINEIAEDGILSAVEKKEVYKEWKSIVSMYPIKVASAANCNVSSDDYEDAFNALGKYLNGGKTLSYGQTPKWFSTENIKNNQIIDADEYRQVWIDYYDEESALSKAISDKLKEQNDETANDLKDIVSDKMLSALEKKSVLNEWLQILDNYDKNLRTADLLELSGKEGIREEDEKLTAYKNAFNDLGKYMNGDYDNGSSSNWDGTSIPNWLSEDLSENTPIIPEEYRNKWTAYNDAERELVNYFVEKANEKAGNAKDEADNANDKIDKITSDSYLSAAEKKDVLKEWQKVVSEVDKDIKNAEYYGLTTEDKAIADYIAAYIYLGEYLNGDYVEGSISHWDRVSTPAWLSAEGLGTDTPINPEEYRSAWLDYYDARIAAKDAITKAIEDYADEIAGNLDTIVSDGILSSLEKKEVLKQWLSIVESYNDNLELADYFGATKEGADGHTEYLNYVAAYTNLGTYMNKDENGNQLEWDGQSVPNWLGGLFPKNTEIVPSEYRSVWTSYSNASDLLRNKFAELSKSLADKAQGDIDKIVSDSILSVAEKKEVLKEWLSIVEIVDEILAHADEYDVDTAPYINAYHALGEYLNDGNEWTEGSVPSWLGSDYDKNIIIEPDAYRKKWTDYYKEQTAILEAKTDKNKEEIDNVKTDVESIVSDSILSVAEKKSVIKEWLNITAEYAMNISTADNFKLTAGIGERGAYEEAYYSLGDYLNGGGDKWDGESLPKWLGDDYGKNTNIIPSEYRKAWSDYTEARTELNNKFSEIAKDKADDAKDEADKANTAINQIIADGVLSAAEKKEVLREWKKVSSAYEINKRNASTYGVSSTFYKNKYEALGTFLNGGDTWKASYGTTPLWLDSNNVGVNTQLENPEAYRTAWVDYYDAEITLLDAISSTIKGIADETKEIVSKNFNADGTVKTESGILTTGTSAEIFAQVFEANNVMTEAKMGAYVQVDPETGKIKSKIVITADDVDINNGVVIIDKTSATIGGFTIGADSITGGGTYKMSLIPDNVNGHPSITWSNNLGTTFAEMGVTVMDGYLEEGNVFLRSYRGDKLSLSPSHFEFILDELDGDIRNSSFSFSMSPIGDSSLLFAQTYSSKQHTFEMGMNLGYFRMKSNSWLEAEGLAKTGEVYVKDGYLMVKK